MLEQEGKFTPETIPGQADSLVIKEYEREGGGRIQEISHTETFRYAARNKVCKVEDIKFITDSGKIVSLKDFMPPGWSLLRNDLFIETSGVHSINKTITYGSKNFIEGEEGDSEQAFLRRDFFLFLFHELGHANVTASETQEEFELFLEAKQELGEMRRDKTHVWSEEEKEKYKEFVIQDERNAWAWALRHLKRLKESGIDLIPGLENADIRAFIDSAIGSQMPDISIEEREKILARIIGEFK